MKMLGVLQSKDDMLQGGQELEHPKHCVYNQLLTSQENFNMLIKPDHERPPPPLVSRLASAGGSLYCF